MVDDLPKWNDETMISEGCQGGGGLQQEGFPSPAGRLFYFCLLFGRKEMPG